MNTSKKINVNFSSLVGLKAELLRKQAEIKDLKAKEETQPKAPKPKVKRKKTKAKTPKTEPGYTEIEDVNTLRKSKLMLEAKSMLYDKLKKSGGDNGRNYLVDFGRKSSSSDDEFHNDDEYQDANSDPEDDWVEYEDCFGRTRKCLRRDLPKMREKDDMVKREISKEPESEERRVEPPEPASVVPEKEPEIELMRKKWEEQMERLADKTDIHYQDVLFDEARAHGVGYYTFSQNEEERAKQQENLAKLRKETERRQKETKDVKDIKDKMELNRLRAATIRQRVRAGLPAELTEDEEAALRMQIKLRNSHATEDDDKQSNPTTIESPTKTLDKERGNENSSLVVVEDKIKAFAELLGKRPKWHEMSQEEWIHKRRRDRLGEFAPVYENFRRSGSVRSTRDNRITTREGEEEDPVRINAAGPEPTDRWETETPIYENDDIKQEINENPTKTEDSDICNKQPLLVENYEDKEGDEIQHLPSFTPSNPMPPSFINSFVPQPTPGEPLQRLSFVRTIPPPSIINFSVPPPTITHTEPIVQSYAGKVPTISVEDSSDSDDSSTIIGPVPPPSINDLPSVTIEKCGPSLIDKNYLNMISEIPLPAAVQFPIGNNRTDDSSTLEGTTEIVDGEKKTANNLDAVAAGLKYLRQKFEQGQ